VLGRLFLTGVVCGAAFADGSPDVVIVVLDDVSDADLDLVPTPAIDSLAVRGRRFRRAYAMPVCSPTRYCMLFGERTLESTKAACETPENYTASYSIADMFKEAGYATAAFGKWHVGGNSPGRWERTAQRTGFDVWRAGLGANVRNCGGRNYRDWLRAEDGTSFVETKYQTEEVRDSFMQWWQASPSPRFAWVAFQAPHGPFHNPPARLLPAGWPLPAPTDREKWEAMLASADFALAAMLGVIDLERTIVVVVGDNGTPQEVASEPSKAKATTYEGGVRVPLIVSLPHTPSPGVETQALAHLVDLFSTLEVLVRTQVDSHLDSRSLHRVLEDPLDPGPHPWVYVGRDTRSRAILPPWAPSSYDRAVIGRRWKLRNVDGVEELYDLEADPREESPLPATGPEAERLRAILTELQDG